MDKVEKNYKQTFRELKALDSSLKKAAKAHAKANKEFIQISERIIKKMDIAINLIETNSDLANIKHK